MEDSDEITKVELESDSETLGDSEPPKFLNVSKKPCVKDKQRLYMAYLKPVCPEKVEREEKLRASSSYVPVSYPCAKCDKVFDTRSEIRLDHFFKIKKRFDSLLTNLFIDNFSNILDFFFDNFRKFFIFLDNFPTFFFRIFQHFSSDQHF